MEEEYQNFLTHGITNINKSCIFSQDGSQIIVGTIGEDCIISI